METKIRSIATVGTKVLGYTEFSEKIENRLKVRLGSRTEIRKEVSLKNNNVEKRGIYIRRADCNVGTLIYLEDFYRAYTEGDATLDEIEDYIFRMYLKRNDEKIQRAGIEQITDFEKVRDKVMFRLISTAKNKKRLEEIPHIDYMDLSLAFYVLLGETEEGTATMLIKNSHMKEWGVTLETLLKLALRNEERECRAVLTSMDDIIISMNDSLKCGEPNNILESGCMSDSMMYVLTNKTNYCGASALFQPGVADRIRGIFKKDLWIIPSSIHELILVPVGTVSEEEINKMIREINEQFVDAEEILSDHCYYFSYQKRTFLIGGTD